MRDTIEKLRLEFWERKFWLNVEKVEGNHWLWKGAVQITEKNNFPYGLTVRHPREKNRQYVHAHRAAWAIVHGDPLPSNVRLFNHCGYQLCVNPDHWSTFRPAVPSRRRTKLNKIRKEYAFGDMTERNRQIVAERMKAPMPTMQEIADKFGITRQRVDQILRRYEQSV